MKQNYRYYTGHDRSESRIFKKSFGPKATERRKTALAILEKQLVSGEKPASRKGGAARMLNEEDVIRIQKEIMTLKKRIQSAYIRA